MRPVPVCSISSSFTGTAEPVSINCPNSERSSTSERTLSHNEGIVCHSSIRRGVSPLSSNAGFISASCLLERSTPVSPNLSTLFALRIAVVVFPHHLAPSTNTAPLPFNLRSNRASTILALYSAIYVKFYLPVREFGVASFGSLALFRSGVWRKYRYNFRLIS